MKYLTSLALLLPLAMAGQQFYGNEPLAHTYSIVAIDESTGEMGVAVQSHWFSVGTLVIWGEAGVGVVATQSFVNPALGPKGLELMKLGLAPSEVLSKLLAADPGREVRQVAMLNAKGEVAAHTGNQCIEAAGHQMGEGYSVQANLMDNDRVWPEMAMAFESSQGQPLAERLVAALEAAQAAGGDIRGKQSAAILVVAPESSGKSWVDRRVDLRIEDHPEPVKELRRLLTVHRAYEHMNRGDLAVEKGDVTLAMEEYGAAEELFPDNLEMKYWHAISLANIGKIEESLLLFAEVFRGDSNWKKLTPRLIKNQLLTVDEATLERILKVE
ncbi:MAG: hypothetical protein DHS20C18_23750 [Saprospiraceae bacterium]|nr:MAG: hypothetical protein DHS20C18_23750 [Saprospiraceae bacterium]